jgi:hypothetical protein
MRLSCKGKNSLSGHKDASLGGFYRCMPDYIRGIVEFLSVGGDKKTGFFYLHLAKRGKKRYCVRPGDAAQIQP